MIDDGRGLNALWQRAGAHQRLDVEQDDRVVLREISIIPGDQSQATKLLGEGAVVAAADGTFDGEADLRILQFRAKEDSESEAGCERIRIGLLMGGDEDILFVLEDV